MDETHVVTGFLHNRGDVLLLKRSEEVGSYQGKWGAVAGHAEGDPDEAIRQEIHEETGVDADQIHRRRSGAPFSVDDPALGTRWIVHPFLFDVETRTVTTNWETARYEWVSPTEILRRETVPDLWKSYDRVRPTVTDIVEDTDHGAATLSLWALEQLRDEAGLLATGRRDGGWDEIAAVAEQLRSARPAMCVVANRINRVMDAASDDGIAASERHTPVAVERRAHDACRRAVQADADAAANAEDLVESARVATLSRSGTVLETLTRGAPEAVLVAESRPGREGIEVAEELARILDAGDVTVTSDAAFPAELARWGADVLLVGADTILPDARILNKVGTYPAAAVAEREGIDVVVVTSTDKVSPETAILRELRDSGEIYDGEGVIDVENPTFEPTPPAVVDAISTERGVLDTAAIAEIAAAHRARAEWA